MAGVATTKVGEFEQYRRLLFAIAYRMVGTAMEAEDIVQEAYLRYQAAPVTHIENLKGYLTTITTRLCLDFLKTAQTQRQSYFGIWLPEPTLGDEALLDEGVRDALAVRLDSAPSPADIITQQESISVAFLVILEQLTPIERAVLLLRGVFDYEYSEIAQMVERSEANCRQIFHRAQAQVRSQRPRFDVTRETHAAVVSEFMSAIAGGKLDALLQLLAEDVTLMTDGGGKASAVVNPLLGQDKVVRFLMGLATRGKGLFQVETREINGRLGVLLYNLEGGLENVFSFDVVPATPVLEGTPPGVGCAGNIDVVPHESREDAPGGMARVRGIYITRNPDKLVRLQRGE